MIRFLTSNGLRFSSYFGVISLLALGGIDALHAQTGQNLNRFSIFNPNSAVYNPDASLPPVPTLRGLSLHIDLPGLAKALWQDSLPETLNGNWFRLVGSHPSAINSERRCHIDAFASNPSDDRPKLTDYFVIPADLDLWTLADSTSNSLKLGISLRFAGICDGNRYEWPAQLNLSLSALKTSNGKEVGFYLTPNLSHLHFDEADAPKRVTIKSQDPVMLPIDPNFLP